MARPRQSFGPVVLALIEAAGEQPGTVIELAVRAQVGRSAARYTASRLVDAGVLELLTPPRTRPAVLRRRQAAEGDGSADLAAVLSTWR